MAELMVEGKRRCDWQCHFAKHATCACLCGGRYHGKGDEAEVMYKQDVAEGVWDDFGPTDPDGEETDYRGIANRDIVASDEDEG